ncbi:MAG TPA: YfhO family protein [Gemmatimonadaceae bacterium]|nr:YfhO family protein [Gemmatimonadaceae bacterium]
MAHRYNVSAAGTRTWVIFGVVTAVVFVIANRLLVTGHAIGIWDADGQYFPRFVLVADHARAGQFLRWDPWTDGGLPSFSEPQIGAFSPIVNVFGVLFGGNPASFIAYWLVHWALGGAGIFQLARHLRAPAWGACVVALGYLFSGVYTGHAQHTSFVAGFSWLPWIIWQVDLALERRSLRHAVQAGAIWGVGALAGHPSITILTGCFAALWVLGRVLFGTDADARDAALVRRPSPARGMMALSTMAAVGIVVLSPTYVGELMEGRGVHSRSEPLSKAEAAHNELPPSAIVTLTSAYPARVKAFFPDVVWPATNVSMVSVYSGVLIPLLALCTLVSQRRNRWLWWLLGVGMLSVTAAMGESLPVRAWLYDLVYPTRFFRHSAVFRLFFVFVLAVLALHGSKVVDRAMDSEANRWWARFVGGAAIVATVAIAAYEWLLRSLPVSTGRSGPLFALLWVAPVAVGIAGLMGRRTRSWVPAMLVGLASFDGLLAERLSRLMMERVDENAVRWQTLDARHQRSIELTGIGLSRTASTCEPWSPGQCWLNDQLITKLPSLRAYATFTNDFHYVMSRHGVLRASASGEDRVWFATASTVVMAPPTDSTFAAFVRRTDSLGAPPLVVHTRAEMLHAASARRNARLYPRINSVGAAQHVAVEVVDYRANEMTLRLTAPDSGWLMVTDRWAPGWRATVNAKPVSTFGANFIFRAVPVGRGVNVVHFSYRPAGYPWLLAVSWLTLAGVLAIATHQLRRRKQHRAA